MKCQTRYTPYSFRHSFATVGISKGTPLQYIQKCMRHRNVKTTMQYEDKNIEYRRQAAYAHPFFKSQLPTREIIEDWIGYIKKTADGRFDTAKLQTAFAQLYKTTVISAWQIALLW